MTDADALAERVVRKLKEERQALLDAMLSGIDHESYMKAVGTHKGLLLAEHHINEAAKLIRDSLE